MSQTNKETTPEEKGAKFLEWVGQNQTQIKRQVRKNITYDSELFEDCFAEAIISVYNAIIRNDSEIDNLNNYFFLAFKWKYQTRQNQKRKQLEINVYPSDWETMEMVDDIDERNKIEERENDINDALTILRDALIEEFGEEMTELFFKYWKQKTIGGASYSKLVADCVNPNQAQRTLFAMKKYVNEELSYLTNCLHQ